MQTGGGNDHGKTGTDGGYCGQIGRQYRVGVQGGLPFLLLDFYDDAIAADCVLSDNVSGEYQLTEQLLKTGRRKIAFVGSVCSTNSIMDRYLGYTKALLRAGINRKSVMLTVGYPPLPFCLDAGSRRKPHRAGSRLYSSTGFVLHTLGLPLWGDYGEVPAKDLLFKKGATCLWQSSN